MRRTVEELEAEVKAAILENLQQFIGVGSDYFTLERVRATIEQTLNECHRADSRVPTVTTKTIYREEGFWGPVWEDDGRRADPMEERFVSTVHLPYKLTNLGTHLQLYLDPFNKE